MKHGPSERDSVTLWRFTDEEAADPSMGGNLIHIKDMVKKRQSCKGGPQKDNSEYLEDVLVDFPSLLPVVHLFCGYHQFDDLTFLGYTSQDHCRCALPNHPEESRVRVVPQFVGLATQNCDNCYGRYSMILRTSSWGLFLVL